MAVSIRVGLLVVLVGAVAYGDAWRPKDEPRATAPQRTVGRANGDTPRRRGPVRVSSLRWRAVDRTVPAAFDESRPAPVVSDDPPARAPVRRTVELVEPLRPVIVEAQPVPETRDRVVRIPTESGQPSEPRFVEGVKDVHVVPVSRSEPLESVETFVPVRIEPTRFQPPPRPLPDDSRDDTERLPTPDVETAEPELLDRVGDAPGPRNRLLTDTRVGDVRASLGGPAGGLVPDDYVHELGLGEPVVDNPHGAFAWTNDCPGPRNYVFYHEPLYFEDANLERMGCRRHSWIQPVSSAALFFGTIPILPYKMGVAGPTKCVRATPFLGPCQRYPWHVNNLPPPSWRGAAFQAAAVTGLIFAIP